MDLKKKLEYLRTSPREETSSFPAPKAEIPASLKALTEHVEGELIAPEHAPVLKRTIRLDCPAFRTSVSLTRLSRRQIVQPIELDDCLFFDLETTGLNGGAGTYPFLLGFGYFVAERFVIEQYFLPDFGREYFVFKEIEPLLARKRFLISYNGKSYDLPLLKSRAIMNRLNIDFERFQHIDLLHLARRVWKDSQDRCDLNSVESLQLGLTRQGDIYGGWIPQAYLNFLNTGVIHDMIATIEHNVQDIHSLAKLLLRLAEIEERPHTLDDASALQRLAQLAFELGDFEYFEQVEQALQETGESLPPRVQFLKSLFHKKRGEWGNALELWEKLTSDKEFLFPALEELAKYYEHRARNRAKALEYCEKALKYFEILAQLNPYGLNESLKKEFIRRCERLQAKLS